MARRVRVELAQSILERRRRRLRLLAGVGVGITVIACAMAGWASFTAERLVAAFSAGEKAPIVAEARAVLDASADSGAIALPSAQSMRPITALLIGSDTREPGTGRWANSDTLILARLDPMNNTISLLSIPRDLKAEIPRHSPFKINSAYALGGPKLAIETVQRNFRVRINHFAVVDFASFQRLVNAMGGVHLPVDRRYFNKNSDSDGLQNYAEIDLRPGYQRLNGTDALAFVRYRHTDSDFVRNARQELFLTEAKRQATEALNARNARTFLELIANAITSDLDEVDEVVRLAEMIRDVPDERIYRTGVEGNGYTEADGRWYLHASDQQRADAVRRWREAGMSPDADNTPTRVRRERAPARGALGGGEDRSGTEAATWGLSRRIAASGPRMRYCVPARQLAGTTWGEEAIRPYLVAPKIRALALSGTLAPGRNWLLMQTPWAEPPLLDRPFERRRLADGRTARLYWGGGRLRVAAVARKRGGWVWIHNTLPADIPARALLRVLSSCR